MNRPAEKSARAAHSEQALANASQQMRRWLTALALLFGASLCLLSLAALIACGLKLWAVFSPPHVHALLNLGKAAGWAAVCWLCGWLGGAILRSQ